MEVVHPPPLDPGGRVAVVAPSRVLPETVVETGVERLRERLGVEVTVHGSARAPVDDPLAPEARAAELHRAFESEAGAVVAVTGGSEALYLLRHLDLDRFRASPTRFFGISDNTCLHAALSAAGVVSYYGPQFVPGLALDDRIHPYTETYLRRALFDDRVGEINPATEWTDDYDHGDGREWEPNDDWTFEWPDSRIVTGRVWGGCVAVVHRLLAADRFVPSTEAVTDGVLALETSELLPDPYWVRSTLVGLGERGLLERFSGVVVGRPKTRHREPRSLEERRAYRDSLEAAIREECRRYRPEMPIVFDVDFGHTDPQVPLPMGSEVRIDPAEESISFV